MRSRSNCSKVRIGLASILLGLGVSTVSAQSIPIDGARVYRVVIGETNNHRTANGVAPLAISEPLMRAAQQYAEFQARTNTTGHTADGRSPGDRIALVGYKACGWAENVYEQWSSPALENPVKARDKALSFWKNSPAHDRNLRNPRMKHIGVGVAAWAHGARQYYKIVQVFGDDCAHAAVPAAPACAAGHESRLARAADRICVTSLSRAKVAYENRIAATRIQPGGGAYGPNTCRNGFVWREAFDGDLVCVEPYRRDEVRLENRGARADSAGSIDRIVAGSPVRF